MSFLDSGSNGSIFLEIGDAEHKKTVRPLVDKPTATWGHALPTPETVVTLSSGKAVQGRLRDFHWEVCTATNRKGMGCRLHNRTDPAWDFLGTRDQTNKKGQRVDFPSRCRYTMPVWSYEDNDVRILEGGPQVFEGMAKFSDDDGKDVRTCDWKVWKTGQNKLTKYESSRQDASTFDVKVTPEAIAGAIKECIEAHYTPLKDAELEAKVKVLTPDQLRAQLESEGNKGAAPSPAALPGASGTMPQLVAADPRIAAMRAMMPNKTDDEIIAILAAASLPGGPPTNFQVAPLSNSLAAQTQSITPKAPVANPQQKWIDSGDPSHYVVEQGKHAGKSLGELAQLDPKYLQYIRAQGYDDTVRLQAGKLLDAKPVMPEPVVAVASMPAPTAAPVTQPSGQVVAVEQPKGQTSEVEETRVALVKECALLVSQIKDFQGPGLSRNFIPLLKSIASAKRLNYKEEWTVPELLTLKAKLNEKLGNVATNPHIAA